MDDADPRITAEYIPQEWVNDYAMEIDGRKTFDCTNEILTMSYAEMTELEDDDYSSDDLALRPSVHGDRSGPFVVHVETAIREFLEKIGVEDAASWDAYRTRHSGTPRKYTVGVTGAYSKSVTLDVEALNPADAATKAEQTVSSWGPSDWGLGDCYGSADRISVDEVKEVTDHADDTVGAT